MPAVFYFSLADEGKRQGGKSKDAREQGVVGLGFFARLPIGWAFQQLFIFFLILKLCARGGRGGRGWPWAWPWPHCIGLYYLFFHQRLYYFSFGPERGARHFHCRQGNEG